MNLKLKDPSKVKIPFQGGEMARPLEKLTRDRKTIQEKTIVATEKKQNKQTN